MPQEMMNIIWSVVGIVLTGLASWLVARVTMWINSKVKDKKAAELLTKVVNIISNAVKQIYQQFVESLKKEGKFTAEAAEEAKNKAIALIKAQLTAELSEFITSTFGDIDTYITNQIEVALYNLKNK